MFRVWLLGSLGFFGVGLLKGREGRERISEP